MKKIVFILFVFTAGFCSQANAQKFGYVNATEIMFLMPEMKRVEFILDSFQVTLDNELQEKIEEYKKKEKKVADLQEKNASKALIDLAMQEFQVSYNSLNSYQGLMQQEYTEKRNICLKPLNDKILKAIKDVSTEKGLTYVFDISTGSLLYWEEKDNVNKEVRKKLGIAEDAVLPNDKDKNK